MVRLGLLLACCCWCCLVVSWRPLRCCCWRLLLLLRKMTALQEVSQSIFRKLSSGSQRAGAELGAATHLLPPMLLGLCCCLLLLTCWQSSHTCMQLGDQTAPALICTEVLGTAASRVLAAQIYCCCQTRKVNALAGIRLVKIHTLSAM